jgi:aldose 1-epimerase
MRRLCMSMQTSHRPGWHRSVWHPGLPAMIVALVAVLYSGYNAPVHAAEEKPAMHTPTVKPFGKLADGREAHLYVLETPGGWRATVTDYGAILTSMTVPLGKDGPVDVVLGFDSLEGYLAGHPYFGASCGRCSNRIANGRFSLAGKEYQLATNNGDHHLHGGDEGFDKKLWKAEPKMTDRGPAVTFHLVSPDGEEGYPGELTIKVTYILTPAGELVIDMQAQSDAATVCNMVHHSYWNMAGQASGTIRGHELTVNADRYLPVDAGSIPTGELAAVAETAFDFRPERAATARLGDAIDALPGSADGTNPGGVDHNLCLRGWEPGDALRPVAVLRDPASGRTLSIESNQPGVQVYTGNYLDGSLTGKEGAVYEKHSGVCLETQSFPDAIHHVGEAGWPAVILEPGQTYHHRMVHRFSQLAD